MEVQTVGEWPVCPVGALGCLFSPSVGPPLTELKLRLSFFDKTTDGDPDAKEPVESEAQSRVRAPS